MPNTLAEYANFITHLELSDLIYFYFALFICIYYLERTFTTNISVSIFSGDKHAKASILITLIGIHSFIFTNHIIISKISSSKYLIDILLTIFLFLTFILAMYHLVISKIISSYYGNKIREKGLVRLIEIQRQYPNRVFDDRARKIKSKEYSTSKDSNEIILDLFSKFYISVALYSFILRIDIFIENHVITHIYKLVLTIAIGLYGYKLVKDSIKDAQDKILRKADEDKYACLRDDR